MVWLNLPFPDIVMTEVRGVLSRQRLVLSCANVFLLSKTHLVEVRMLSRFFPASQGTHAIMVDDC